MKKLKVIFLILILFSIILFSHQSVSSKTFFAIKDEGGNIVGVTDVHCITSEMMEQGHTLEYLFGEKPTKEIGFTSKSIDNKVVLANSPDLGYQYRYSGTGDDYFKIEKPEDGFGIMKIAGNFGGEGHFSVWGYNEKGNRTELFVNTTDIYEGTIPLDLEDYNTRYLEVSSKGKWLIYIIPIGGATFIDVPSRLEGKGDDVIVLRNNAAVATISGNREGKHFAVKGHFGPHLMVNTTSPYEGTVKVPSDTRILEITATGVWVIDIR